MIQRGYRKDSRNYTIFFSEYQEKHKCEILQNVRSTKDADIKNKGSVNHPEVIKDQRCRITQRESSSLNDQKRTRKYPEAIETYSMKILEMMDKCK